jgi:phage terminase small subunit
MSGLSPRAERFAREYPKDMNATLAAIRSGYSQRGAAVQGHRLLRDANVQAAIKEWRNKVSQKLDLSKESVLAEYAKAGFAEPDDAPTWGDKLKALEAIRKMLGFDAPTELSGPGGGPIEISDATPVEIARRMAFALAAATAKDAEEVT